MSHAVFETYLKKKKNIYIGNEQIGAGDWDWYPCINSTSIHGIYSPLNTVL